MTRDEAAGVIIGRVIVREGGIGDAGDGEGITRFGQTPTWLLDFGFVPPETPEQAAANYRTWLARTRLIAVCDYPDSLADITIDFAVNSGHPAAIESLQRALGVRVDGILGPETRTAIDACDRYLTAGKLLAARLQFRGRIITTNPEKHAKQAKGWANRDAAQLLALVTDIVRP